LLNYLIKLRIMRVDGILSTKKNAEFPQRITPRLQTKVGINLTSGQLLKKNYDMKSWTSLNFYILLPPKCNLDFKSISAE
jgi:hypothetical protein